VTESVSPRTVRRGLRRDLIAMLAQVLLSATDAEAERTVDGRVEYEAASTPSMSSTTSHVPTSDVFSTRSFLVPDDRAVSLLL
jgi:hypothetical protein